MSDTPDPKDVPAPMTEDDIETMEHPEDEFDPNASPEEIDALQERQAEVVEKDREWIDQRERVGGED